MKQKHIDASREARLWIGQVIVPLVIGTGLILSKHEVGDKVVNMKNKIISKFHKK